MLQRDRISLDLYRLRHPNFQAIQVLPNNLKKLYLAQLENWIKENKEYYKTAIFNVGIDNILNILREETTEFNNIIVDILQQSAKEFYKEYARRHNFDMKLIFSKEWIEWITD